MKPLSFQSLIERRQALRSLLAATATSALGFAPSTAEPESLTKSETMPQSLRGDAYEQVMRSLLGLEPMAGEGRQVRAFLSSFRSPNRSDPRIEPSLHFDPVVDREQ